MAEQKKEEVKEYAVVEVTTQTGLAIGTPEGKAINTEMALAEILNRLDRIEKTLGGR